MLSRKLGDMKAALVFALTFIGISSCGYAASTEGEYLPVPSDLKAKYYVIDRGTLDGMPTVTTKRIGPSGTSYSRRVFDCSNGTGKYIGHGDTLRQMQNSRQDPKMYEMVTGSISWYVYQYACQH